MTRYFPRYNATADNERQYARMLRWQRLHTIRQAVDAQKRNIAWETERGRTVHAEQAKRQLGYALDAYWEQVRSMRHMAAMERAEDARARLAKAQAEGLAHLGGIFNEAAE